MNREERITHDKLLALGFKKVMNTECYYLDVNDFVSCWKEDDDFYWFDDFTFNKDIMDCEILGFSTLREIEIPIINIK